MDVGQKVKIVNDECWKKQDKRGIIESYDTANDWYWVKIGNDHWPFYKREFININYQMEFSFMKE